MNLLTESQRFFIAHRKIKKGGFYMFPRFGFRIYHSKYFSSSEYIYTNPFTKSLDRQRFKIKNIEDGWCYGNFLERPSKLSFYMRLEDLASRDLIERLLIVIFTWPIMVLYNLITKADTSRVKEIDLDEALVPAREAFFTEEQVKEINNHYKSFTILINLKMSDSDKSYSPSKEDFGCPLIWKAEHWRWYFGL